MIRLLDRNELNNALPLVWKVFCDYEAIGYPEAGKQAFWNAIHSEEYLDVLTAYGAFDNDRLIGIIATRNGGNHIALFFVDGEYHRKGVGRSLWRAMLEDNKAAEIKVHSSVFAADIYKRLGFVQTDGIQEEDGIRYIPMVYVNDLGLPEKTYRYPFGEYVTPLVQQDQTPKEVFVLGVYASAVHARWMCNGETVCQALAVASEPRIFWDGDPEEAKTIIDRISIPVELGKLVPAGRNLNGPSAKVLDEHILAPLGFTREEAWLCDCLPETRLNPGQVKVIKEKYDPLIKRYGLNEVTIPARPSSFCDKKRAEEISEELFRSKASLLVLLGDIPIAQYLNRVSDVPYKSLREYTDLIGYGNRSESIISGRKIEVLPLAHPRQIGALGSHSERWHDAHQEWESRILNSSG